MTRKSKIPEFVKLGVQIAVILIAAAVTFGMLSGTVEKNTKTIGEHKESISKVAENSTTLKDHERRLDKIENKQDKMADDIAEIKGDVKVLLERTGPPK